ncbi:MAG TPA: FtsX-like permease family protein, partial [Candidatus Limnocylindrales bacterium]|nr:FtsX-like permease family protein [Candidatus Limnocylindrales bacterium]
PLAVYGQLLLLALAVPFLVGPLGVLAGVLLRGPLRTEERLARGALVRDASRTALTVGALAIGLAMIVAIRTVADTARAAGSAWLEEVVPGELILSSIRPVGLDEGIAAEIAAIDGVARVSPIATLDVAYRGVRLSAVAVVGADLAADGRLAFVAGDRAAALAALDAGGAAIVPESLARTLGLRVGDRLEVRAAERAVSLTVAGIVARSFAGRAGESVLVGWPDALGGLGVRGADVFAVRFAPGRTDARPEVERVARSLALQPATLDAVRSAIGDALGRLFGLFDALGLIAVAVGGLGVANTFAMSVRERIREIAILRATGMTRRQVGRMVVVEAAILGVVGTVLGAVGGTSVAAAIVLLGGAGLGAGPGAGLGPSPGAVLGAAVVGIVVPVVAATYPARIAAGIPIVRGVRAE